MKKGQEYLISEMKYAWLEGRVRDFHRISSTLQRIYKMKLDDINKVKANVAFIKDRA